MTRDCPRFKDELDLMKFVCKDFWTALYKKQVDNLRTNHQVCHCPSSFHGSIFATVFVLFILPVLWRCWLTVRQVIRPVEILHWQLNGSVKEPNKLHNNKTEKITCKASDVAEYIELFGSFTRDRHARRI